MATEKEKKSIEKLSDYWKNRTNSNVKNFYLNTGTSFDLATGFGIEGSSKKFYLNGGLTITNSLIGRPQTYKSSIALSYLARVLEIYKDSLGIIHDSELNIPGIHRILDLSENKNSIDEERIILTNQIEYDIAGFTSFIDDLANKKEKEKDMVETPFINPKTGKNYISFRPTIVAIDSWSAMKLKAEFNVIEEEGLDSSKTNTLFMLNGNAKTKLMPHILSIGTRLGIYFILVGHIGNKINMNSFIPEAKEMQYMKQGDSIKSVGSQFEFLSSNLLETRSVSILQDSNKECQYPGDLSNDLELQKVKAIITKCKNNSSGGMLNHISSQHYGIQPSLEWLELLKEMKDFGLEGNNVHKATIFLPDFGFTRKNIREKLVNYEFKRSLEILGQLAFIRKYWAVPKKVKEIPLEELVKIMEKKMPIKDILNTRGYWTFNDDIKNQRKYLNIIDIINWI